MTEQEPADAAQVRRQAGELAEAERRLAERERHLADQQAAIRGERAVVEALCDRAGLDPAAIRRQATSGPPAPAQSSIRFLGQVPGPRSAIICPGRWRWTR